jgi:hypothetical protein
VSDQQNTMTGLCKKLANALDDQDTILRMLGGQALVDECASIEAKRFIRRETESVLESAFAPGYGRSNIGALGARVREAKEAILDLLQAEDCEPKLVAIIRSSCRPEPRLATHD